jgi:hypothetical protein
MIHLPINGSIPDDSPGKAVVRKRPATSMRTAIEETMRTQQTMHEHPVIC